MLDLMCGGRLEVGIGPGGNLSAYRAFDLDSDARTKLLVRHHRVLIDACIPYDLKLKGKFPRVVDVSTELRAKIRSKFSEIRFPEG